MYTWIRLIWLDVHCVCAGARCAVYLYLYSCGLSAICYSADTSGTIYDAVSQGSILTTWISCSIVFAAWRQSHGPRTGRESDAGVVWGDGMHACWTSHEIRNSLRFPTSTALCWLTHGWVSSLTDRLGWSIFAALGYYFDKRQHRIAQLLLNKKKSG